MQGATILTRFTADTKDLDDKTKSSQNKILGFLGALGGGALLTSALSKSYNIIKGFIGDSVNAYADLEQSVGGVETLFKDSADVVVENAKKAYETAGISANTYMEQVTSFSARLLQSTNGDTKKAAAIADQAMIDMADNANKFGTSIESIQHAYQGLAKQNYTMLDNLKLGYGGTKEEMQRLLADAEKLSGVEYDIKNLSDVYNAIHVIQENLGVTGTTATEASTTITGSMGAAKAAFENFLGGTGGVEEVITTFTTAGTNIANAVLKMLPQIVQGIVGIINGLMPLIPELVKTLAPSLIQGALDLTIALINMLPDIIMMIAEMLPVLMPMIIDAILGIIPALIENIPLFIDAGAQLLSGLIAGIINMIPILLARGAEIIVWLVNVLMELPKKVKDIGVNMIKGLWNGVKSMKDWVVNKVKDIGKSILKGLKGILGIKSPSKEFGLIGKFSVLGYTEALDDMTKDVQKQVNETFGINPQLASSSASHYTPNVIVNNNINMKQDPLGQMVNDIKTFSGGSKNDYNYGMGA